MEKKKKLEKMEKVKTDFYDEILSKHEFSLLLITATDSKLQDEFTRFLARNVAKYFTLDPELYYFPSDFVTLNDFRNYKKLFNKKMTNTDVSLKLSALKIDTNKQDGGLIPKGTENGILFRKACTQIVNMQFIMTNYGCFICQQNFVSLTEYDDHIKSHGKDEHDIPASSWFTCQSPTFVISYDHCTDSNLLNFEMKSNKDISIEKIVIIRPELRKLIHCVDKSRIKISKENRTYNFSIDCFLFDIGKEQPFFVIYRNYNEVSIRQIEKYAFFRKEQFPKSKISVISNSVPHNAQLVIKYVLRQHFPSPEIISLWKTRYEEIDIMNANTIMMQYLLERRLKETNYVKVLSFLLEMEDQSVLGNYEKLTLTNPAIKHLGSLDYSITYPQHLKNGGGKFLSQFDDIVVTTFPSESFYDGDVLQNKITKKANRSVGYVYKVNNCTIFFSLRKKMVIPKNGKFKVKVYPHRVPLRHQHDAIKRMAKYNHILKVLLPSDDTTAQVSSITLNFFNKSVEKNPEQAQAVENIVTNATPSVPYIVFGPPGTGKTTTIVESVLQLWKTKPLSRILITSGSNAACDEVAKKLCKIFEETNGEGLNLLRIYAVSYERKIENTDELLFEASNFAHGYHFYPSLDSIYLFRIVVATLTTCGKLVQGAISDTHFTHIFIDECAASTEPETLIGIVGLMGPNTKLILSGDPKQLGPVLKCEEADNFGLGISMMERLLSMKCFEVNPETNEYDRSLQTILRRNYRSNAEILSISNQLCYNSQLIPCAKPGITEWALGWKNLPTKQCPILFHVVHGETVIEKGETSSKNLAEIRIVMRYVRDILKNGINGRRVTQKEIGVISPYKKQYTLIRQALDSERFHNVETGSAENFQGQEKPIIIISTVKSWKNIGFLKNVKRLNVMLTRAQALMIIVGNPESLQKDDNWFQVLQYFQSKKAFVGKEFKLKNAPIPFNLDLLPNIPKKDNDIKNNETNYQQEKLIFDNYTGTHRQEEVINKNTSRFELNLQNSHQNDNKTNSQQDAKCSSKQDIQKQGKGAIKGTKKKNMAYARIRKLQIKAEKSRLKKTMPKSLLQNSTKSNATQKYDCAGSEKALTNFHQEPIGNPIILKDADKKSVPAPVATVSSMFCNGINIQEEKSRSNGVEKTNTSRNTEKAVVHENLKNSQQNNSIVTSSNSDSNQEDFGNPQQILAEPQIYKSDLRNDFGIDQFSPEDIVKKELALVHTLAVRSTSFNNMTNKDANCLQQITSTPKTGNNSRKEGSRTVEEQTVAFSTMASSNKSSTSNYADRLVLGKTHADKSLARNKFGLNRFSMKNTFKKDSVRVPTATVRPMPCSSTDNNGMSSQQKTITTNQPKTNSTVGRSSDLNRSIQQNFTEAKVHGRQSHCQEVCPGDSEYPCFRTAAVRPMERKGYTPQVPVFNRPQWNSNPSEEERTNLYTRCPPLRSYYAKPQVKEQSKNCVIL